MHNHTFAENWQWLVLWLIFILTTIYSRPLIPIDETRYLSVAWEMWHSGEFLVPHLNGEPYSHKPPLLFWLIHLSWFVFGVGEWSGRIVGPFWGLCSMLLTVKLAKVFWPEHRDVSRAAPFILMGTIIWAVFSSLTMFDTLLTFCSLLGFVSIFQANKRQSILPWIGFSLSIGLGILTKGPIVLIYVLPPVLLMPFWAEHRRYPLNRWYLFALCFLLLGIGLALCWAIPAAQTGGEEYRQAILFSQTVGRMVQSFAHNRPFYWYLLLTPLIFLPWLFWLPSWRSWSGSMDSASRYCLSGIVPAFIMLSLVSGKQLHYILPLLPACSLLLARNLIPEVQIQTPYDRWPLVFIFFAISVVLFVVPFLPLEGGDREILKHLPAWLGVVPLIGGIVLFFIRSQSLLVNVKIVSSSVLLIVVFLQLLLAAPLHKIYNQSDVASALKKIQNQDRVVAVYPAYLSSQFQYSGRLDATLLPQKTIAKITSWAHSNLEQYCLVFSRSKMESPGKIFPYKNGWLLLLSAREFSQAMGDIP